MEQVFTQGKGIVRPFSEAAAVHCRGYSLPLQRVITDFGADVPFGQIPKKLQEHHGIKVSTWTRIITLSPVYACTRIALLTNFPVRA